MTSLLEPLGAGSLQVANRIVMAPLTRNRSPKAVPTELAVTSCRQRAGAGLIVSEAIAISAQGRAAGAGRTLPGARPRARADGP